MEGLATPSGGAIALYRGNLDAFAPQSVESFRAISRGEFPSPYLPDVQVARIPTRPDFLVTGEFIGADGPAVIAATAGTRSLYVLAVGKTGALQLRQTMDAGGIVTALAAAHLRNGKYGQAVVGIRGNDGAELRLFTGSEDGLTQESAYKLENAPTSLAFGNLDGDDLQDVLIVAGGRLSVLHGASRKIDNIDTPYRVTSVEVGRFTFDRAPISQIALAAADGTVHLLARADIDARPFTTEEALARRRAASLGGPRPVASERRMEWKEIEGYSGAGASTGRPLLLKTRIAGGTADDLLILGSSHSSLVAHRSQSGSGDLTHLAGLAADAVAAVSVSVSADSRGAVVFVTPNDMAPQVVLGAASPVFTVNTTVDGVHSGACAANTANQCTLREAILEANATTGATISIPAGTYDLTIGRPASPNYTGAAGALYINSSMTIVGAGQNSSIVEWGTPTSGSKDMLMAVNEDISPLTNATATISNLTLQNAVNNGVHGVDGDGGCMEFDTGTSGAANLTLINVTLNNCATTHGNGAGIGIFNFLVNGPGGVTFINSIIEANSSVDNTSGVAAAGGGIVVFDQARMTMTNGKVMNNKATQVTGSVGGFGGGIYLFTSIANSAQSVIHSSTISGNQSSSRGGGIYNLKNLVVDRGTIIGNNIAGTNGVTEIAGQLGGGIYDNTSSNGCPAACTDVLTLNNVIISGNHSSADGGGIYAGNDTGGGSLSASFSRIALNTTTTGATNLFTNHVTANVADNWWGTNSPATTMGTASGTANFTPFLKLTFFPSTTPIVVGNTSTLSASFLTDSANGAVAARNLIVMDGVPITFGNAQHGSLSAAQTSIQANSKNIASASESGSTVTITTTTAHGFSTGQLVNIAGVGGDYDGTYSIGSTTATTFTYTAALTGLSTLGAGGTASVPMGTATVTFTGSSVGIGTADATIDGFTLTSSPGIVINSPTTTAAVNQTATYNDAAQNATLTANVTAACCTVSGGTVAFKVFNGATQIGVTTTSGAVSSNTASATFSLPGGTPAGTYTIQAVYSGTSTGTGDFLTSSDVSGAHSLTVNPAPTATAVANQTAAFSATDQIVSLSANVTSADGVVNAGTVTFAVFSGATQIGSSVTSGTVTGGAASVNFTLPGGTAIGTYSIHATYNGSTNFSGSTDTAHTLTVNAPTTTTAANQTATFNSSSQTVNLSATVTSSSGTVAGGSVTFGVFNGATQIGANTSGTVASGSTSVSFTLPAGTPPGSYSIHASYGGSGGFLPSSDNTHTLTVNQASTATAASNATATFSALSQIVPLTATVTSAAGTVNAGTVTFTVLSGATPVGSPVTSGTVTNGTASANYTLPGGTAAGTYTIQAVYSGTANLLTSTDTSHTLSVGKVTPVITWNNPADIVFPTALSSTQLNATANVPGTFAYTPGAGTVLPVGSGQMLSVVFTPADTTDFNGASKSVTINVTANAGLATLVMNRTLTREAGTNDVLVTVTISNTGGSTATGVKITAATIGVATPATPLPLALPDIAAGSSQSATLRFAAATVGGSGTAAVLKINGSYSGGSFGGSSRVSLP